MEDFQQMWTFSEKKKQGGILSSRITFSDCWVQMTVSTGILTNVHQGFCQGRMFALS